jgi:signal transduction histidine kinase
VPDRLRAQSLPRAISTRRLIGSFALPSLAVLAAVAVAVGALVHRETDSQARRTSRIVTGVVARSVVAPALSDRLMEGDPATVAAFDAFVRRRVLNRFVAHVVLRTGEGRVVYADQPGRPPSVVLPPTAAERQLLIQDPDDRRTMLVALPSHPDELASITAVSGPRGPLLVELDVRRAAVAGRASAAFRLLLAIALGALACVWILQLPIVVSLGRRFRRVHADREALLVQLLDAQAGERRRIAADLHDGVVQDLAGIALSLRATAADLSSLSPAAATQRLDRAADGTVESMRRLRSLLLDIYPPALSRSTLEAAISDLVAPLRAAGLSVTAAIDPPELDREAIDLIYRVAREAIRNVAAHANASSVRIRLLPAGGGATLEISDDGDGFAPDAPRAAEVGGHFGLRLLRDRARDAGATLRISSTPGQGTTITLEVPAP